MARRHTQLAKSRLLEYSEIQASQIPTGTTVYEVSTLPSTVDETKVFIYVTSLEKYYRIKPKEPAQYDSSTADSGIMMGEPAVNMASGYEALFLHRYTSSGSGTQNDGLSVYKPITESVELNSSSMYTPTAQAVSDFVVPKLDSTTYTTSTPTVTLHENTIYRCTNDGVTSMTINISDMVTGPKTRESAVYFHTGNNPSPIAITGGNASTVVFGDTDLMENQDYWVSVKDNTVTITTNLSDVAISGSYNDLLNKPDLDATLYESVTYSQLVSKISNSELVKGRKYRITDYVTTTRSEELGGNNPDIDYYDYKSAKHPFDLLVLATSETNINANAKAVLHEGDTYFEYCDLDKWQIWYSVENQKCRWGDYGGKGVIYRMIDEWGNDCPYDFKNIMFKRMVTNDKLDETNGTLKWVYTFDSGYDEDNSKGDCIVYNNRIGNYIFDDDGGPGIYLNDIVFLGFCYNNVFGKDCHSMTLHRACHDNKFGDKVSSVVVRNNTYDNTIGNNCEYITINNGSYSNTIKDGCAHIRFGDASNAGGSLCRYNVVGDGNGYINIYNTDNSNDYLQNIYIAPGINNTGTDLNISTITRGRNYRTTVARDSNGNIRIYNEDDPTVQPDYTQTDETAVDYIKNAPLVRIYRDLSNIPAQTTSPYWCARWIAEDPSITEYKDGMVVCVKVPIDGNGSYGTALQINELGYKPIVYNVNTMIGYRYSVGSVVWAVYNATQTATLYLGNGSQSITGCWQVMDYNSDTTTITNVRRYYSSRMKPTTDLLDYVLVFRKNETQVIPMHSTPNGTTGAAAYTGSTSTDKEMTTESFDPFGEILFYRNSAKVNANATIPVGTLFQQTTLVAANSTFNCGTTLTGSKELYLVVDLQSDGMVKLATDVNPWSQTLPATNDGHLYIFLGIAYDGHTFEFLLNHPIYYHDGTQLRIYSGDKIPKITFRYWE